MLFPDFIIEEILAIISNQEIREYRRVCRRWNVLLKPFTLNRLDFNPEDEHDPKYRTLLPKFGNCIEELRFGYLNFGNDVPLREWEIQLIRDHCPNITSLKFNRVKLDGDLSDILTLGLALPKIKHVSLFGKLRPRKLDILQPLIHKLESFEVECGCDNTPAQNRFIRRLNSPILKRLSLRCRLESQALNLIRSKFPPDLFLQITKENAHYSITYGLNGEKFLFQSLGFISEERDLRIHLSFDLDHVPGGVDHQKSYELLKTKSPGEQVDFFKSLFDELEGQYSKVETHLPPIKSISYYNRFLKSEGIKSFFSQLTSAEEIRISTDYSPPQTSFPTAQYKTIKLSVELDLSPHFFTWVSQCFPCLRSLSIAAYVRQDVMDKLAFLKFRSLLFISCPLKQPLKFWRNMISASPNLQVVSTYHDDEYTPMLQREFKHICFVPGLLDW